MNKTLFIKSIFIASAFFVAASAFAGEGTYLFGGNLDAQEGGAPSMTAIDPQSQNFFSTASLYGATRTTYNTVGSQGTGNNAGLHLNASTLVPTVGYSLEMVASFSVASGYRKIADVSGRSSDGGYYVYPGSQLGVYNIGAGTTVMSPNTYYYLALTVGNTGEVKGYINGNLEFTVNTAIMSNNVFDFFVDDTATGFNEYSNFSTGLIRLSDSVLSASEISDRAANPYLNSVPEPASLTAMGLGLAGILARRKKARKS